MLHLTRRVGEKIIIGDKDVVITVIELHSKSAVLETDVKMISYSLTASSVDAFGVGESRALLISGEVITVALIAMGGSTAKIGVDAPKAIAIHREEIYDRIKKYRIGSGASKS